MGQQTFQPENPPKRSGCTGCSWALAVPVGCIALVLLVSVGIAALGGLGIFGAMKAMKSSDFYAQALERVQANAEVTEGLGSPIKGGIPRSWHMHSDGTSSDAEAEFRVSGPKGKGVVNVEGVNTKGTWEFTRLDVTFGGATLDLLAAEP